MKLEMATALTAALLTAQLQSDDVPGRADAQQKVEAELASRMGVDISVADIPDLSHFGQVAGDAGHCRRSWRWRWWRWRRRRRRRGRGEEEEEEEEATLPRPGRRLVRELRVERGRHHPRPHGLLGCRRPSH